LAGSNRVGLFSTLARTADWRSVRFLASVSKYAFAAACTPYALRPK
jgi:hypothetical protein